MYMSVILWNITQWCCSHLCISSLNYICTLAKYPTMYTLECISVAEWYVTVLLWAPWLTCKGYVTMSYKTERYWPQKHIDLWFWNIGVQDQDVSRYTFYLKWPKRDWVSVIWYPWFTEVSFHLACYPPASCFIWIPCFNEGSSLIEWGSTLLQHKLISTYHICSDLVPK